MMIFKDVNRVLIYRLGSIGDTTVALPALHLIERTFPGARRIMLTNVPIHAKAAAAYSILRGSGLVDGYMDYPIATRNPMKLARLWWQIVRFRPQVLIYMVRGRGPRSLRRDQSFFRSCGITRIVGLPVGVLDEPQYDASTGLWEKEASRLLRCLEPLGQADVNDLSNWDLHLTMAELKKGNDVLAPLGGRPLIACGPGTKMQAKDWGQENWRELLERLNAAMPQHGLVLVGAKEDSEVSDYAAAGWCGPVVNLCGQLTPRETAAVVKHAEVFLGPDSGPMHMAAAYGVPCAIAFAARDRPGRWYPAGEEHRVVYHAVECRNCQLETCIEKQKICLTSISVEEMVEAAMEAWKNGQSAASLRA